MVVSGAVTKITNFGVFVELEENLEGLLHISELADQKIGSAEEVVNAGDKVSVKIIRVDPEARKIGLSLKEVEGGGSVEAAPAAEGEDAAVETPADGDAEAAPAEEPAAEGSESEAPAEEASEEPAAEGSEAEAPAEEASEEPAEPEGEE